jgi:hypothetical protein
MGAGITGAKYGLGPGMIVGVKGENVYGVGKYAVGPIGPTAGVQVFHGLMFIGML